MIQITLEIIILIKLLLVCLKWRPLGIPNLDPEVITGSFIYVDEKFRYRCI